MTEPEITDRDLLRQINTIAHGFLLAVLETVPGHTLGDGEAVIVFDSGDPPTIRLDVNGVQRAEAPMDVAAAPTVGAVITRGLARTTRRVQARAGTMLATGEAFMRLVVPIGADVLTVHGVLIVTDPPRKQRLFTLRGDAPQVH